MNIAVVYRFMEKNSDALVYLKKAYSLEPDNPETSYGLGEFYFSNNQNTESLPYIEKAFSIYYTEKSPYLYDAAYILGVNLYFIEDWNHGYIFLDLAKEKYSQTDGFTQMFDKVKAKKAEKLTKKERVLKLIELIKVNPASMMSKIYYEEVLIYSSESDDVIVNITEEILSFFGKKDETKWFGYLLGAYIAGNMESQLLNNETKDDMESGVRLLISTYLKIKEFDPTLKIDALENRLSN